MDTQVLTLFGEEDFQPPPPRQKSKGKDGETRKKGQAEQPGATGIAEDPAPEEPLKHHQATESKQKEGSRPSFEAPAAQAPVAKDKVIGFQPPVQPPPVPASVDETEAAANEQEEPVAEAIDDTVPASEPVLEEINTMEHSVHEDEIEEPENEVDLEDTAFVDTLEETQQEQGAIDEDLENEHRLEDELLDRQLRSELIQADYTAFAYLETEPKPAASKPFILDAIVTPKKTDNTAPVEEPELLEENPEQDEAQALPEWQLESRYYSIGEVAKLFEVNTSHIRFWTNEFKLKPRTTRKGDRLYNTSDIAQLRLIHHLVKVQKHTIKGAREKLKEKDLVESSLDLSESLGKLKDLLIEIRNQL